MKVKQSCLIVLQSGQIGGAERILMNIAKYLIAKDIAIKIVLLNSEGKENWLSNFTKEVLIIHRKEKRLTSIYFLMMQLRRDSFDWTISSNIHVNFLLGVLRYLRLFRTNKLIARETTSIFYRFSGLRLFIYKLEYYLGYKYIDKVICQTEFMKKQLLKGMQSANNWNIEVIPNPINIQSVEDAADMPFENIYGIYIVAAGRLIPEKGFDLLINAFSKLENKELKLVILGDGKEKQRLISIAKNKAVFDRISFNGFVQNPMPYFKNAKLCVVSSRIEGFPNVLLQMIALNTSVVSTLCADGIEYIPNIITCKPNSENELLKNIEQCLQENEQKSTLKRKEIDAYLKKRNYNAFFQKVIG